MTLHTEVHPLAGQTVSVQVTGQSGIQEFVIEDWWDHLTGSSWMNARGNFAAMNYAIRTGLASRKIPIDDEVVYGKIGAFGHLVHVSEIISTTSPAHEPVPDSEFEPLADWERELLEGPRAEYDEPGSVPPIKKYTEQSPIPQPQQKVNDASESWHRDNPQDWPGTSPSAG